jgi:BirA family transcriptional regulator, biotin operon repressor / biotin---[acetyl-CoA-carboxylase] ligase
VSGRLAQRVAAIGTTWPAPIHEVTVVSSTNDELKALAQQGAPEWTAVVAERQTAGRGRHGRSWASRPGDLFLSALLRPAEPGERSSLIPLAAGIATSEALERQGVVARLKWPNDLLVAARKIGGILCESSSGSGGLEAVVVGIGVNVAAPLEWLPPEVRGTATSMLAEGASNANAEEVGAAVLTRLRVWYHALRSGADVVAAWRARSVSWWGEPVEVQTGQERLRGRPRDISPDGGLLLELDGGRLVTIVSGGVKRLRPTGDGRHER